MTDLQLELETLIQSKPIESTETKVCSRCGQAKPRTDYYQHKKNGPEYVYDKCKVCYNEVSQQRNFYNRSDAPSKPDNCDCCGEPLKTKACYDHDHKTGKFRGWLCYNCNGGIGKLGDDLEGVIKAVKYLTPNL